MEDKLLAGLAGEHGTPLYVYDGELIRERCKAFKGAFSGLPAQIRCLYAIKANTNLAILRIIRDEGFGADIVSSGELDAAISAGFDPDMMMYTSNSKSLADMEAAIEAGVHMTVGNMTELEYFKKAGGERIAFRVNPDVDAKTHPKISTSLAGSKFGLHFSEGIAFEAARDAVQMGLKVAGIHCHIGSNVKDMSGFLQAAEKMVLFAEKLKEELDIMLDFIDLGGGLGVPHEGEKVVPVEEFGAAYGPVIEDAVARLGYEPQFWFEPGRYLVAEAGVLLAKVNSVKKTPTKSFVNADAGFNDLIRPAMYDAYHHIRVLGKSGEDAVYDIAGNLCESGDILGKGRMLPKVSAGDIIAVENAGAYGFSMASNYNSMPFPAEVLVRGERADVIRDRQSIQELYLRQRMPDDL